MIGFNGGLIGQDRTTARAAAVGVWTLNEQIKAKRNSLWPITGSDLDFASVSLLLHGDGTNGSTTITDSSPSPKTVTAVGSAQISTTQSKFGGASLSFIRSPSSYLTIPFSSAFQFSTGNFTVEAWVYMNALPSSGGYPNSFWIVGGGPVNSGTGFDIAIGSTNLQVGLASFDSLNINAAHGMLALAWYHVAVVRSVNTLTAYINGSSIASVSVTGVTADPVLTGLAVSAAEPSGATQGNFNGYIDELRITKGVARYTANFTAPIAPFPNF